MKQFDSQFTDMNMYSKNPRKPNFNNLLKVLKGEIPERPTLFELFLNDELHLKLICQQEYSSNEMLYRHQIMINAFKNGGYDYVTVMGSDFCFKTLKHQLKGQKSLSLNEGTVISDRESFEKYNWLDPADFDYSRLETLTDYLPEGMKLIVYGPGGVLENVISLVGYDNLCYMLADDRELVQDLFDAVGSRLVKYYEICSPFESVGAVISNDDWGFNSQTMLAVEDMKKYVIPWHKKIVEVIHASGKPAILHSCGRLDSVMEDIIEVIKYDAKHSYEDKITPVEEVYEKWGSRIAILGGIDLDFICRSTPEEVYNRGVALLERTKNRGGYALGSGNSIPYYIPNENYLAMIAAANW
jgi:uroporphyrinogen decarboxylase